MRHFFQFCLLALLAVSATLITGCDKDSASGSDSLTLEERGFNTTIAYTNTPLVGLTSTNELLSMVSGPPAVVSGRVPITGLRDGERILAIDTRPKTRELFGVSDMSFLYTLDPETGVATLVSDIPMDPAVKGDIVSLDFNPMDDLIRLTTDAGQNLRISPVSGAVVGVDLPMNFGQTVIASSAYSYVFGSGRSMYYGLSAPEGVLWRSGNPNSGALQYVGDTGFDFLGDGGFEITNSNTAFVAQYCKARGGSIGAIDNTVSEAFRLMYIDLKSGKAVILGEIKECIGLAQRG